MKDQRESSTCEYVGRETDRQRERQSCTIKKKTKNKDPSDIQAFVT